MPRLKIEPEYAYGGETNYQIVESNEGQEDEIVATVYGRRDIAEMLVHAEHAFDILGKM